MDALLYKFVRPIITFLFKIIYRPTIKGRENISESERLVLAGNHTNNFDCLLLISSTKRCIHFLGKHTLLTGLKGKIFKGMGVIPVDRTKNKNHDSLIAAENILNQHGVIGIFPESTINREKKTTILPFKMGAVKMAHDTSSKIVPFVIKGSYQIFRKNITIEFLKPIKIESDNLELENKILMRIITEKLERQDL